MGNLLGPGIPNQLKEMEQVDFLNYLGLQDLISIQRSSLNPNTNILTLFTIRFVGISVNHLFKHKIFEKA